MGAGAALGLGATTAPAAARDIDPGLVAHWMTLLRLLYRHDAMFGPRELLGTVRREIGLIAAHRQAARGALRTDLLRVESRWSCFASWLSNDAGNGRGGDHWADRSLRLAREAGYQDQVAWVLMRRSQWAIARQDYGRVLALADAARGTTDTIRGLCALKQAHGHALANDAASCERRLTDARDLLAADAASSDRARPWDDLGRQDATRPYVLADVALCWLWLRPHKSVAMLEDVLRLWPKDRTRGRGIHQARLALACASTGEPDRAAAEGVRALKIAQRTRSDTTVRELTRLDRQLAASGAPAATEFHEAFAAL